MSKTWKEADKQREKFSSLGQVVNEVSKIPEDVSKLLSSFTQAREHRVNQEELASQREIEKGLLKDREKLLDRNLTSVWKEFTDAEAQNESLLWSRCNVDKNIKELKKYVGAAFIAVTDSAQ